MINGELRSKIDSIWNTMWSGGISNPLSVIEQLTYLLFIKRLDERKSPWPHITVLGGLTGMADDLSQHMALEACLHGLWGHAFENENQPGFRPVLGPFIEPFKRADNTANGLNQ